MLGMPALENPESVPEFPFWGRLVSAVLLEVILVVE